MCEPLCDPGWDHGLVIKMSLFHVLERCSEPSPVLKHSGVFFRVLVQGVTCILPVLREGVLTGSPEQKEEAAKALGAVIKLTSAEALRPSVVNITGPLIRILGDRFAWTVKTALLETLTLLLAKVCTSVSVPDTDFNQSSVPQASSLLSRPPVNRRHTSAGHAFGLYDGRIAIQ